MPRKRAPTPQSENVYIKDIVNTLNECHDVKIKSLGPLIQTIFNTTDNSLGISKKVTDGIQKLKPISGTNKELSKSNLKTTNDLIKRLKTINVSIQTLQQTVGKNDARGLTNSYKQVVEAIVKYAENIRCPEEKSFDPKPFDKIITSLQNLDKMYIKHQLNYDKTLLCEQLGEKKELCKKDRDAIKKSEAFKNFKRVYDEHIYSKEHRILSRNIEQLKAYLQNKHGPSYRFFSNTGGLIHQLNKIVIFERMKLDPKRRQRRKQGGSKHHKTKTTKKRIKGKQTRRNKAKNTTTIKAKNKTTIKAKNKTKKR